MEALLPLIITFGLMWALLIRPQQRRVRQHQELVASVSTGDEVITTGGIVGTIASVVDDIVTLEVAPGTSIRLLRSAIQTRISPYADDVPGDDELDDDELFDEGQFDAEPVAEPLVAEPLVAEPLVAEPPVAEPDVSYIPPPKDPPTSPPPTGEKA